MSITQISWNPNKCGEENLKDEYTEPKGKWKEDAKDYKICKSILPILSGNPPYVLIAPQYNDRTYVVPYKKGDIINEKFENISLAERSIISKNITILTSVLVTFIITLILGFVISGLLIQKSHRSHRSG